MFILRIFKDKNLIKKTNNYLKIINNFSITKSKGIPRKWWFKREELKNLKHHVDNLRKVIKKLYVLYPRVAFYNKLNILVNFSKTLERMISLTDKSEMESLHHSAMNSLKKINNFVISNPNKSKSEIDWKSWNSEIPNNKDLMDEYLSIEKKTKKKGIWMKNHDGTDFEGTSEQFIQQYSINFKKAFPNTFEIIYRGAHQHITDFKNKDRNDYAIFFIKEKKLAEKYANVNEFTNYYHPDTHGKNNWIDGVYQVAISNEFRRVISDAEGRSWRLLNWDERIAKGTKRKGIVEMHNKELKEFAISEYNLRGQYDDTKKYLSTDIYANYVKNPNNSEAIAIIKNVIDVMGNESQISTDYIVDVDRVPIKSLRYNNGMFDMTNPDIYK